MKTFSHLQIFLKENYLFFKFTHENIFSFPENRLLIHTITYSIPYI